MATVINGNCTDTNEVYNKSCVDTFLNKTVENGSLADVTDFWPTFSPSIMKILMIAMNSFFLPVVVIIGLLGNTATIYVLKKRKQKAPTILLLISLAVADLMCICMQIVYLLIQNRNHHFKYMMPYLMVNGFFMTRAIFYFDGISRLIKVVIVLERCVAVVSPLKVHIIFTTKRVLITVFSVFALVPLSSVPELMHIGIKGDKSSWSTYQMALQAIKENKLVFEWYGTFFQILYGMITLLINLVSNIVIFISFRKSSMSSQKITNANDLRRATNQRKLTRMLLKMSTFYVITCLPKDIGAIILLGDTSGFIVFNGNFYFQSVLLFGLSSSFLNNSVNFIIYGASNSRFRHMYKNICCCCGNAERDLPKVVSERRVYQISENSGSSANSVKTSEITLDRYSELVYCSPYPHTKQM